MSGTPFVNLARRFPSVWTSSNHLTFQIDGYRIELIFRTSRALVVTFNAMRQNTDARLDAWGLDFLARKRCSALHVVPEKNCWYRRRSLETFFVAAQAEGLFRKFDTVMTYGGSMGGFGALSFAGLSEAHVCLAMNPQVRLGSSVRQWETRFLLADLQDWSSSLCNIDGQITNVRHLVVVYDPYYSLDRRQIGLIDSAQIIHLKLPFVGHHIPVHLQQMGVLSDLFDDALKQTTTEQAYHQKFRHRRRLKRYRNMLLEKTNGKPRLREIVEQQLVGELIGID